MIWTKSLRASGARKNGVLPILADVTLEIEPGLTCLLGTAGDGGPLFLEVCAGAIQPRAGEVRVLGNRPARARPGVCHVPFEVTLPEVLTVEEILVLSRRVRGQHAKSGADLLARLGVSHLAKRRAGTLSRAEARSVALVAALHADSKVLLLDEPFAGTSLETPARIAEILRERARDGAHVLVATASARPPIAFETTWLLSRGALFSVNGSEPIALAREARLRVITPDARVLSVALATLDPEATGAAAPSFTLGDGHVVLAGTDVLALAKALGAAVCASAARVVAVVPDLASIDQIKEAAVTQTARPSAVPPSGRASA